MYREIQPYIKRINRRPNDVSAYLNASRALQKAGYTSYARQLVDKGVLYSPQSLELLMERARIEEASGVFREALKDYEKVLESASDDVAALRGASRSAYRSGSRSAADRYLARARALSPDDPGLLLDEAQFAYFDNDLEKALSLSREASRLAPHLAGPYYNEGLALLRLNRLEEALDSAEKALTLAPNAAEIHSLIGELKYAMGDDAQARSFAEKAVEISPYFDQPCRTLAKLALKDGDIEKAAGLFRRAVELNPSDAFSLLNLRRIGLDSDNGSLVLYSLRRLSRLDPEDNDLRMQLADTALKEEQYSEAAAEFRSMTEKRPGDPAVWRGLGRTYAAIDDHQGVIEAYSWLDALGKAGTDEYAALADSLLHFGAAEKAEPYVRRLASELPPGDPRLARLLGQKLFLENRPAEALGYLMTAAASGDEDAAFKAALVAASIGRKDEAVKLFSGLHADDPSRADLARLLAQLMEGSGDDDGARKVYDSILALNPDDVHAGEFMASYLLEHDDLAGAEKAAAKVLAVSPRSVRALETTGAVLEARGDNSGALAAFRKALELEPARKDIGDAVQRVQRKLPESVTLEDLRSAWRRSPDNLDLLRRIADLEAVDDPARAVGSLRRLAGYPRERRDALEKIAGLYRRMDQQPRALAAAREIIRFYPEDPSAHTFLAGLLAEDAEYAQALKAVGRAVEISPNYVPALKLSARIKLAKDDVEGALTNYLMLRRIDPMDTSTLLNMCRIYTYHTRDFTRARACYSELQRLGYEAPDLEKAVGELETPLPDFPMPDDQVPAEAVPVALPEELHAEPPADDVPEELPADAAASIGPDTPPAAPAPSAPESPPVAPLMTTPPPE